MSGGRLGGHFAGVRKEESTTQILTKYFWCGIIQDEIHAELLEQRKKQIELITRVDAAIRKLNKG